MHDHYTTTTLSGEGSTGMMLRAEDGGTMDSPMYHVCCVHVVCAVCVLWLCVLCVLCVCCVVFGFLRVVYVCFVCCVVYVAD